MADNTFNTLIAWLNKTFQLRLPTLNDVKKWPVIKSLYELAIVGPLPTKTPFRVKVSGRWKLMPGQSLACTVEVISNEQNE